PCRRVAVVQRAGVRVVTVDRVVAAQTERTAGVDRARVSVVAGLPLVDASSRVFAPVQRAGIVIVTVVQGSLGNAHGPIAQARSVTVILGLTRHPEPRAVDAPMTAVA